MGTTMTWEEFSQLIQQQASCPAGLSPALQGLWYAKKGDWHKAHNIVQAAGDRDSNWVHAYLHREEGDIANAHYWYRRSGQPAFSGSLDEEWEKITRTLLNSRHF